MNQIEPKEMKIDQTIRKNLGAMGFAPNRQQQTKYPKISRYQGITIALIFMELSKISVSFFHEASDVKEYMDATFVFIVAFGIFFSYISIIFRNDDLFNVIELAEKEIIDSGC